MVSQASTLREVDDVKKQTKVKVALNMVQMSKTGAQNTDSIVSGSFSYLRI